MMTSKNQALAQECKRISEGCLYTSTSFFIWLKVLRIIKIIFIILPVVLGSLASWKLLASIDSTAIKHFAAISTFISGLMPSIYSALKFDDHLECCKRLSGDFKNLQDRFRQLALVSSKKEFSVFEEEFKECRAKLETARAESYTPPDICFWLAQRKIKKGDYDFDVDCT